MCLRFNRRLTTTTSATKSESVKEKPLNWYLVRLVWFGLVRLNLDRERAITKKTLNLILMDFNTEIQKNHRMITHKNMVESSISTKRIEHITIIYQGSYK